MVTSAVALLVVSQNAFLDTIRAHESNNVNAVRITATAISKESSSTTYTEIWTDGFAKARVWIRDANGPTYKIYSDYKTIQLLEVRSNRFVEATFVPGVSMYENIVSSVGGIDPLAQIYLDSKVGIQRFLLMFGKFEFVPTQTVPGEFRITSPEFNVRLLANAKDKLIDSIEIKSKDSTLLWQIGVPEFSLAQGLSQELPKDASKVQNFAVLSEPTKSDNPNTDKLIAKSRTAYDSMKSVHVVSKAVLWSPSGNQVRNSKCWWDRGNRIRFEVSTDKPFTSFSSSFDGKKLVGIDSAKSIAYTSIATSKNISKRLDLMGAQYEPMVVCFMKGFNFWDRLVPSGSNIKTAKDFAMVGKEKCNVIIATTVDGWTATIYIRQSDFLIGKIERLLQPSTTTLYKETVTYDYSQLNKPLPASTWQLKIPTNFKVKAI